MQIFVLGMHRSGTSAVTRVINLMGACVGAEDDLMPPQPYNPKGFWERSDVASINDALLASVGSSWSNTADFDPDRVPRDAVEQFETAASGILADLSSSGPCVIKDPRLCLVLPFWLKLAERPVGVLVYRSPVEVARSLNKRDDLPLLLGVALWEQHVLSAMRNTFEIPRTLVHFDELIARPEETSRRLHQRLSRAGVHGLEVPASEALAEAVDPGLRHHTRVVQDDDGLLNEAQADLCRMIENKTVFLVSDVPSPSIGAQDVLELHRKAESSSGTENGIHDVDAAPSAVDVLVQLRRRLREVSGDLGTFEVNALSRSAELRRRQNELVLRLSDLEQRTLLLEHWRVVSGRGLDNSGSTSCALRQSNFGLERERESARIEMRATQWHLEKVRRQASRAVKTRSSLVRLLADEVQRLRNNPVIRGVRAIERLGRGMAGREVASKGETTLDNVVLAESASTVRGPAIEIKRGAKKEVWRSERRFQRFQRLVTGQTSMDSDWIFLSERARHEIVEVLEPQPQDHKVSVVMLVGCGAAILATAIDSVRTQSYVNWELIVVDDGSDDGVTREVKTIVSEDPQIRWVLAEGSDESSRLNEGLRIAGGTVVTFLGSDSYWEPDALLLLVNALLESGRGWAYGASRMVSSGSKEDMHVRWTAFDPSLLKQRNYVDVNSFACRAELAADLGGFDETLRYEVDWDLILRCAESCPPAQIPGVLSTSVHRRRSSEQESEAKAYRHVVMNSHVIDWEKLENEVVDRLDELVSVVIPVYGQIELVRSCVEALRKHTPSGQLEVVVVDNGCGEEERRALKVLVRELLKCELVENGENLGFALGCNLGFTRTNGSTVVFLNSDTEVSSGWLAPLVRPLHNNPSLGVVGPKLLYPDETLQSGGIVFSDWSSMPYNIYQGFPKDHAAVNYPRVFQAVTGACMAVRAVDFAKLRGFDAVFINGCEDVDFCLRLQRDLGKLIYYSPCSEVMHREGASVGRSRYIMQNRRIFARRWERSLMPDDSTYYEADGLSVEGYEKPGNEPDGETAIYLPKFALDRD